MSKCANCGRQYLDHRANDHACPVGAKKPRKGYLHYRPDSVFLEKPPKKGTIEPKKGTKSPVSKPKKGTYINVHFTDGKRVAVCTPYGNAEWENTMDPDEVTCRSCLRCMNKRS